MRSTVTTRFVPTVANSSSSSGSQQQPQAALDDKQMAGETKDRSSTPRSRLQAQLQGPNGNDAWTTRDRLMVQFKRRGETVQMKGGDSGQKDVFEAAQAGVSQGGKQLPHAEHIQS